MFARMSRKVGVVRELIRYILKSVAWSDDERAFREQGERR